MIAKEAKVEQVKGPSSALVVIHFPSHQILIQLNIFDKETLRKILYPYGAITCTRHTSDQNIMSVRLEPHGSIVEHNNPVVQWLRGT